MLNADRLEFRFVDVRLEHDVAVVTVDDPPANTLTHHMVEQLEAAFVDIMMEPQIRAVVLTGACERFICGGVNIGMLANVSAHDNSDFLLYAGEVFDLIEQTPVQLVAAVNGHITGGGLELALLAHRRIGVEGTYNCGFPEARLGVIPGLGGTQRLSRLVGASRALELIIEGEFVTPARAQQLGIFDVLLPRKDFLRSALATVRQGLTPANTASSTTAQLGAWRTSAKLVSYKQRAGIALITLNAQCATASTLQVLAALNEAILSARHDASTEALLITHEGAELVLGDEAAADAATREFARYVYKRLTNTPRLCVLAFRGSLGPLATELACACDYRLVPQLLPAEQIAFAACSAAVQLDSRMPAQAAPLSLAQARERNLVRDIDAAAALPEAALAWLTRFTAPRGASKGLGYAKLAIRRGTHFPEEAGRMLEWHLQEQLFRGHDAVEGMRAYLEKRTAHFKGE
jgi:enoyl-CoA hydratase/carnithine racemase